MSVSAQETVFQHVGNGVTVTFAYGCQVLQAKDLQVYLNDELVISGFSISGIGVPTGGAVTFDAPPANLARVRLERDIALQRLTDYQQNGDFLAVVVNLDFNRLWMALQQHVSMFGRALLAPRSDATGPAPLPTVAERANKLLSFDSAGNPIAVAPVAGTATALQLSLAADNGLSLLGFKQALDGATPRTAKDKLLELVSVEDFFLAAEADQVPMFNRAAASGAKNIRAVGRTYALGSEPVVIRDGQMWDLSGSTFTTTTTTKRAFSAVSVSDWSLNGPFKIVGSGSAAGSAVGIYVEDCTRWRINNPTIVSIPGAGIKITPGASASARSNHGLVENPRIDACYNGWVDEAGSGAEFCTVNNIHVTGCTNAGITTSAGNIIWIGGHCVDNILDGFVLAGGPNHAHGMVSAMNINHNGRFNLYAAGVANGQTFTGCHFYAYDAAGNGSIFIEQSKGINISGGHLDCAVYNYKGGASGLNVIENMYCPGSYGVSRRAGTNDGHGELLIRNCYGPGAYAVPGGVDATGMTINDPAACYVRAERSATMALTNGVAATLLWSSKLFDRRNAFNIATGLFTTPAGSVPQSGLYRLSLDLLFNGSALNAADSYLTVLLNGVARKFLFPTAFGTSKLCVTGTFDIYLTAGDTLALQAVINGTSPLFGDNAMPSNFSIQRIA